MTACESYWAQRQPFIPFYFYIVLHLSEAKEFIDVSVGPFMLAVGALPLVGPESVHDGLEDGGERRHPDPRSNEDGVLGPENVTRRSAVRAVNVNLVGKVPR